MFKFFKFLVLVFTIKVFIFFILHVYYPIKFNISVSIIILSYNFT